MFKAGDDGWTEIKLTHGRTGQWRILGVADMAKAIMTGRRHRADAEMGFHVLDVMYSILESAERGVQIDIASSCRRPEPLPCGLPDDELD